MTSTRLFLLAAVVAALPIHADGAVLWTTTFSGTTEAARSLAVAAGDPAFTDGLTATSANLTFSDATFTGSPFVNVGGRTQFSPNTNVDNPAAAAPQNGGSWQSEFRYTGGTQSITLDSVRFDITRTANGGAFATATDGLLRQVLLTAEYSLDGGGSWTSISAAKTVDTTASIAANPELAETYTFASPLTIDHATQDLWLRFKAENTAESTGAYINLQEIAFNGSVVPEPAAPALAIAGLVGLLLRRRRTRR